MAAGALRRTALTWATCSPTWMSLTLPTTTQEQEAVWGQRAHFMSVAGVKPVLMSCSRGWDVRQHPVCGVIPVAVPTLY